jgi:sugar phosphate permease
MCLTMVCCVLCRQIIQVRDSYLDAALMFLLGLFVYGPCVLLGTMAAEITKREGASTALGLAGVFAALGMPVLLQVCAMY